MAKKLPALTDDVLDHCRHALRPAGLEPDVVDTVAATLKNQLYETGRALLASAEGQEELHGDLKTIKVPFLPAKMIAKHIAIYRIEIKRNGDNASSPVVMAKKLPALTDDVLDHCRHALRPAGLEPDVVDTVAATLKNQLYETGRALLASAEGQEELHGDLKTIKVPFLPAKMIAKHIEMYRIAIKRNGDNASSPGTTNGPRVASATITVSDDDEEAPADPGMDIAGMEQQGKEEEESAPSQLEDPGGEVVGMEQQGEEEEGYETDTLGKGCYSHKDQTHKGIRKGHVVKVKTQWRGYFFRVGGESEDGKIILYAIQVSTLHFLA